MKCANPTCNHGIGLISYRRGWFAKRQFCSRQCRDRFVVERAKPPAPTRNAATTYVEWLFMQPGVQAPPRLAMEAIRVRAR
jgi:hypothetical protein